MARAILAAVFFIILMTVGASAISYQGEVLGHTYDSNETINADSSAFAAGEVYETTNANIDDAVYDDDSKIVVTDANGVEVVEGEDYEWNENNGTIAILSGSSLTDDASLDIEYGFTIRSDQQGEVLNIVGGQMGIGQALMYVFGAVLAIAMVRIFAGAG